MIRRKNHLKRLKSKPFHKNIGKIISQLRYKRGWTQEDLATKTGYTRQVISEMELGQVFVNEYKLEVLGGVFGIHPDALRGMADTTKEIAS